MITSLPGKYPWTQKHKYSEQGFVKLLLRHAKDSELAIESDLGDQIGERAAEIFARNRNFISDQPSQFHLLLTSYLLSAVETLEVVTTAEKAKDVAGRAFVENGRIWISLAMKTGLLFSRDKFEYIRKNSGEKVIEGYGNGFDISVESDESTYSTTRVHKCGFNEFFIRNGRPELTKLMCDWDNNWSDVLNSGRHVSFSRPTTIASGHESCDFQFRKTAK